jgi:O-methyltransferase
MIVEAMIDRIGSAVLGREKFRRLRFKRAQRIGRRYGYEVYKPHLSWLADPGYKSILQTVENLGIDGIANDRCYTLLDLARRTRPVAGEIAECGVRYGKSSHFILGGSGGESSKEFHIFDSFAGLSAPTAADLDRSGKTVWSQGQLEAGEDVVRDNLRAWSNRVFLHKGWIPERFSEVADKRFSFVHVDVDLHEPTRDSFEFFYPRMAKGGVMVCDDYGFLSCPGATRAVDEFFADKPEAVLSLTTGQSVVLIV